MATDAELAELRKLPLAIDRSWDRTPLATFAAKGCVGVMGYLSFDPSKNWTKALVDECHAAGMWVGLNWEGTGGWDEFAGGASAGRRAGQAASNQADALGAPSSVPIFVSADYDVQPWQHVVIAQWLDAFKTASGHPVGIYGEADLIDVMLDTGHAVVAWQTNAYGWSGGRISAKASLVQFYGNGGLGAEVDENRVRDASKFAWHPDGRPPAPSAPVPEEDDMNRADTIALLRAPEFSQKTTRDQVAALTKQVQEIRDEQKATNLMLLKVTKLLEGDTAK